MRPSFAAAFVAALAVSASAVPSDTSDLIPSLLAELPDGLGPELRAIMRDLRMDDDLTHVARFHTEDVAEVNHSLAFIQYPTPSNDFFLDFVIMTNTLDPSDDHVLMVCGHTTPSACASADSHASAPEGHPCGVDDATDPALAASSGAFCEVVGLGHDSTPRGELLAHGKVRVESVARAHEDALAEGRAPEVPVIHVEIVDAEAFAEAADLAEETLLSYEDDPIELERRIAEDEGVDAFAPGPAPGEDATAADLIPAEGASAPSAASAPTGSFNARRLLRIGGIGGGIRGAGMRAGIGGVRRFGGGVGYGRAGLGRRNRSMATNQVLAASYYGRRGGPGRQRAYFNDPGIPNGR